MKKLIVILSLLVVFSSMSFAAEKKSDSKQKFHGKTTFVGINPLGLIFSIYSGQVGFIMGKGATELNIPFFYWAPTDDLTFMGGGVEYLWYKDKNGEGIHYGPTFSVFAVSADLVSGIGSSGFETKNYSWITYTPGVKVGYRWVYDSGFTLAPSVGAGYMIGELDTDDDVKIDASADPGFQWSIGIGLAYMW